MSMLEDIRDVVENSPGSNDEWARFNCPVCHLRGENTSDHKRSLSYNSVSGYFQCWRCDAKGFLKNKEQPINAPPKPKRELKYPTNFWDMFSGQGLESSAFAKHREYVLNRGVLVEVAKTAKLKACVSGRWANRIIVPCYIDNKLAGWSARSLFSAVTPRYLYPKGMLRGEVLFNQDALFIETERPIYIVEGVFDALVLYPDAAAVLGKPSNKHFNILLKAKRPLVVVFDGDSHEEGWAFSKRLQLGGAAVDFIKLPPTEDPASMGKGWVINKYER